MRLIIILVLLLAAGCCKESSPVSQPTEKQVVIVGEYQSPIAHKDKDERILIEHRSESVAGTPIVGAEVHVQIGVQHLFGISDSMGEVLLEVQDTSGLGDIWIIWNSQVVVYDTIGLFNPIVQRVDILP